MSGTAIFVEVHDLFSQRCSEVTRYLRFLTELTESRATKLARLDSSGNLLCNEDYTLERELVKTLRANGYLLLYNLVEATMTNAVDAIHRSVDSESVRFDELSDKVKQIVLHNFRRVVREADSALIDGRLPLDRAIVALGYDKKELFSGNVDARLIRDTASKYGFSIAKHDTALTRNGERLLKIKTMRNELAHGLVSFEDCGHNTAHDELVAIANETIRYLQAVLDGIERYVEQKSYALAGGDSGSVPEVLALDELGMSLKVEAQ